MSKKPLRFADYSRCPDLEETRLQAMSSSVLRHLEKAAVDAAAEDHSACSLAIWELHMACEKTMKTYLAQKGITFRKHMICKFFRNWRLIPPALTTQKYQWHQSQLRRGSWLGATWNLNPQKRVNSTDADSSPHTMQNPHYPNVSEVHLCQLCCSA